MGSAYDFLPVRRMRVVAVGVCLTDGSIFSVDSVVGFILFRLLATFFSCSSFLSVTACDLTVNLVYPTFAVLIRHCVDIFLLCHWSYSRTTSSLSGKAINHGNTTIPIRLGLPPCRDSPQESSGVILFAPGQTCANRALLLSRGVLILL